MQISSTWCEAAYGPKLLNILSDLHQHPELSNKEFRTSKVITEVLESLDIRILNVNARTGVIGYLKGGIGTAVALRADIDAIPQFEHSGKPDSSLTKGIMHGCGHDIHTTSLLGAAMILSDHREQLKGDVYFIFQPAEECLSGASYLLNDCALFDAIFPDIIFGLHNYPEFPIGTVGVKSGQLMSYKDVFTLHFVGRSGHSSMPQKNIDPIVAAASFIQSVQTIVSRNVGPLDSTVISICQLHAGDQSNLIVNNVMISGNIRTLDAKVRERVLARFHQIAIGTADTYECELKYDCTPIVPGVNNPEEVYPTALAAAEIFGNENIKTPPVNLASEDFALYGKHIPSFFYFLGSGAPDRPVYSWHNAHFYPDERTPIYGAALLAQSVIEAQK